MSLDRIKSHAEEKLTRIQKWARDSLPIIEPTEHTNIWIPFKENQPRHNQVVFGLYQTLHLALIVKYHTMYFMQLNYNRNWFHPEDSHLIIAPPSHWAIIPDELLDDGDKGMDHA